jgi:hypothetical protein
MIVARRDSNRNEAPEALCTNCEPDRRIAPADVPVSVAFGPIPAQCWIPKENLKEALSIPRKVAGRLRPNKKAGRLPGLTAANGDETTRLPHWKML